MNASSFGFAVGKFLGNSVVVSVGAAHSAVRGTREASSALVAGYKAASQPVVVHAVLSTVKPRASRKAAK